MFKKIALFTAWCLLVLLANRAAAQQGKIVLDSLLKTAAQHYPLLKAKHFQSQALQAAIRGRQNTLIPSLNASYQLDYATANNITGMVYPQYITPISGPTSKTNDYNGTPGSAVAINLQWEPITFGQRAADVELAKGNLQYGRADENLTVFQQQIFVINAWLNYLLLSDLIKVYHKDIDRSAFNLKQAQTLVTSGLRPGTDSSSFHAEYTRTQIQLLSFERQQDSTLIALKELVGGKLPGNFVADSLLLKSLPGPVLDTAGSDHPEIQLQKASVDASELMLKSLRKSVMPKLTLWSVAYGRGSGIAADGAINSSDGLRFQHYNYGFGVQIAFPILEVFRQKPFWKQQELNTQASREVLAQTALHLNTQQEIAANNLKKALQAAQLAPQQNQSADFTYKAILSRYRSGLINYYDVIQAQQLLFQSEANVRMAYYSAWKALLNKAAYDGNVNLFLNQYRP